MTEYHLNRSEARDPKKYAAAKTEAAKKGLTLIIVDDMALDEPVKDFGGKPDPAIFFAGKTHVSTDAEIFITREGMRDHHAYRRLREQANKNLQAIRPIDDWDSLDDATRDRLIETHS